MTDTTVGVWIECMNGWMWGKM